MHGWSNRSMKISHDPQRELIARAIIVQDDAFLVNYSLNKKTGQAYCALPGGHVDPGESCTEALVRELQEEASAEIEILDLCFVSESIYAGRKKEEQKRHELVLYYHAQLKTPLPAGEEGLIPSPEKNKNFRWLSFDKLEDAPLLPESVWEFLMTMIAAEEGPHYVFTDSTK